MKRMNRISLTIGAILLAGSSSPALAQLSDAVRRACETKAEQVTPPLRAGEKEAYIANCLADATATQGSKSKKGHGY